LSYGVTLQTLKNPWRPRFASTFANILANRNFPF